MAEEKQTIIVKGGGGNTCLTCLIVLLIIFVGLPVLAFVLKIAFLLSIIEAIKHAVGM